MKFVEILDDEKFEDLGINGLQILQSKNKYRFTSDSVILSNLVKCKQGDAICDLGTGSGIVAILLSQKTKAKRIVGVEIQNAMADMAKRSVIANQLEDIIEIVNIDLKQAYKVLGNESFEVVVANPPYEKCNQQQNENQIVNASNLEVNATLLDFVVSAKRLLKFGGKFFVVLKAKRMAELICLLSQNGLEPKTIHLIFRSKQDEIDAVVIEAVKGANVGAKVVAHYGEI